MQLRLLRGVLIGNQWHDEGEIIDVPDPATAERYTRSGCAIPHVVLPGLQTATAPRPVNTERATAPRQRTA